MEGLSFEQALARLDEITKLLEDPNTGLDASISLYKEASELSKYCGDILNNAKQQFKEIGEISSIE